MSIEIAASWRTCKTFDCAATPDGRTRAYEVRVIVMLISVLVR
jgi:hypothetical protein